MNLMRRTLFIGLSIPIIYYLYLCVSYVLTPSFFDHIEPSIVMQSFLVTQGKQIFTDLNNADRISSVYGPVPYIATAFFLNLFSDPILAGKISGIFLTISSLIIMFVILKRNFSTSISVLSIAYFVILFLPFGHISFWNRPDSAALFGCSVACWGLLTKNKVLSSVLFALGTAICIDAKIPAVFVVFPVLIIYLQDKGLKMTLLTMVLSLILVFVPFFFYKSFNLINYIYWLIAETNHPFLLGQLVRTFIYSILFTVPLFLIIGIYFFNASLLANKNTQKQLIINVSVLLICFLLAAILASKEGSGSYHLLPFVYVIGLLLASIIKKLKETKNQYIYICKSRILRLISGAIGAFWIIAIIFLCLRGPHKRFVEFLLHDSGQAVRSDLLLIKSKYHDSKMVMGYTGNDRNADMSTFFRPLLFQSTSENFLDAPAMMDMSEAGLPIPEETLKKLASQPYDLFILPNHGHPFSMNSWFTSRKLVFGKDLPRIFNENYTKIDQSKYYIVYKAKRLI